MPVAELAVEVSSCPTTRQERQAIADVFAAKSLFFHALGTRPRGEGGGRGGVIVLQLQLQIQGLFHSIILMALVDTQYTFMRIPLRCPSLQPQRVEGRHRC